MRQPPRSVAPAEVVRHERSDVAFSALLPAGQPATKGCDAWGLLVPDLLGDHPDKGPQMRCATGQIALSRRPHIGLASPSFLPAIHWKLRELSYQRVETFLRLASRLHEG